MEGQADIGGKACTAEGESSDSTCDILSADRTFDMSTLKAPSKKPRGRGKLTKARDKPNYEIKDKRSRFCSICRGLVAKDTKGLCVLL